MHCKAKDRVSQKIVIQLFDQFVKIKPLPIQRPDLPVIIKRQCLIDTLEKLLRSAKIKIHHYHWKVII